MFLNNKKNILIITDTRISGLGGSENHIRFILSNMNEMKYNFYIAEFQGADKQKTDLDIIRGENWPNVEQIKLNVKRIYGIGALKAWWLLTKLIANYNIDIIISFHEKSDIINALLSKKIQPNLIKISSRRDMNISPSPLLLRLRKFLSSRFDFITAPCQAIITMVEKEEKFLPSRTQVIHNSVDVRKFAPNFISKPTISQAESKADYKGVCLSNLKEVKGHKYLLDAFEIVVKQYPSSQLLLLGEDHGTEQNIRAQISRIGLESNVKLLGGRTDIHKILSSCDYMVCSSLSEGLSNALLEGLACGLPIVATNVGGNNEIVDDGANGLLCQPKNPHELANKIMQLFDPAILKKMGSNSRQIACSKFSTQQIVTNYDNFFSKITKING